MRTSNTTVRYWDLGLATFLWRRTLRCVLGLLALLLSVVLLPNVYAQAAGAPVAPDAGYRLGAGDIVRITVYNQPELTTEAQIKEAGQITFALVGEVKIAGLDKAAAESLIAQKLRDGGFVRQPQVNLLVTASRYPCWVKSIGQGATPSSQLPCSLIYWRRRVASIPQQGAT
jgi:hypothetical protein